MRAGPGASNPIVGTLAYDATGVEVIRIDGRWGLINVGEATGWTSMRFLTPEVDGTLPNRPVVRCFGNEPFWSLNVRQGQTAVLTTPMNREGDVFAVGLFQRAWGPLQKYVLRGQAAPREISVVVAQTYCDDGMSDQEYGFDATVIISGADGQVFSGCCRLRD